MQSCRTCDPRSEEEGPCDNCRSRNEGGSDFGEADSINELIPVSVQEKAGRKREKEQKQEERKTKEREERKTRKYMENAGDDSTWGKTRAFFRKVGSKVGKHLPKLGKKKDTIEHYTEGRRGEESYTMWREFDSHH